MVLHRSIVERLVEAATLAPSSHNTQPWRFQAHADTIELWADRSRALPANDPHDRELTISCGCTLANLELAAAASGFSPSVEVFPDGPGGNRMARVHMDPRAADPVAAAPTSIAARHTYRGRVAPDVPDVALQARLLAAADRYGARLHVLEGDARTRAAALVDSGDRAQWDDPRWRRELALWMREWPSADSLLVPGLGAPLTRTVVRMADVGAAVGPRDADSVRKAPSLGLLATSDDDPPAWLAAGCALQAVLLEAAAEGFQAAYFNQPVQVEALRPVLGSLCSGSASQVLFRVARPTGSTVRTARRTVTDVLDFAEPIAF